MFVFVFFFSFLMLVGSVSAWDVEITKLNNNEVREDYSVGVTRMSFFIDEVNCSEDILVWYVLNGIKTDYAGACSETEITLSPLDFIEGENFWEVYVNNSEGNIVNDSVSFWVDSIYPDLDYVTPSSNLVYTNQDSFNFQFWLNETNKGNFHGPTFTPFFLSVYDPFNSNFANPDLVNLSFGDVSLSEVKNVDFSNAGNRYEGDYTWIVFSKDVYPNGTQIREVNLTGTIIRDTIAPKYFNEINQLDNTYAPGKNYTFSINWTDERSGIDAVWINFSGEIYQVNETFPDIYGFIIVNLAAGEYNYTWFANDSAGNVNTSGILSYTVEKAVTTCSLLGEDVEYPNLVNMTAYCNHEQGSLVLYRDDLDVSAENSQLINLPFGTYLYKVNMSETSNYTSASVNKTILVSKGTGQVFLSINGISSDFSGELPQNVSINASLVNGVGTINITLNGTNLSDSSSDYFGFHDLPLGYYNLTVYYSGNENYSEASEVLWINVSDTTSPSIILVSPSTNLAFEDNDITFIFNSSDLSGVADCSLFLGGVENQSGNDSIFTAIDLTPGSHNWKISCTDSIGNSEDSETRYFTILDALTNIGDFSEYTNLIEVLDISSVLYFFVNNSEGMINWTEEIDFSSGFDWSALVEITNGRIFVDSLNQPGLNKSAILMFYNINFTRPEVLKDGTSYCSSSSCYSYSSETGILSIEVSSFSTYTVREYVPIPVGSSSGGGSSCTYNSNFDWQCSEWSECVAGIQTRTCLASNNCGTSLGRPETQQVCVMEEVPVEESIESLEDEELSEEEVGGLFAGLTGAVIGLGGVRSTLIIVVTFLILSAGVGVILFRRNRQAKIDRFVASINTSIKGDNL